MSTPQPTPETDSYSSGYPSYLEWLNFARKLERERDEALAKLSTVHRWIERNHPDGFIDSQSHLQNLDRVADAWHEKLESMREAIKDASKTLETSSRCLHGDSYYKAQSTIAKLKPFFPMKPPLLSILTPACWERVKQCQLLADYIAEQITEPGTVEHLVLYDNRHRSIGLKRQALLDAARGQYIAFVDDDDDVSSNYVEKLIEAIEQHPEAHVITFEQRATYNGKPFNVTFQHGASDQHLQLDGPDDQELIRGPWHVCAWRRDRIAHCQFLDTNYGEDAAWVKQARTHVTQAHHIPQVLHFYHHDARTTLAPELTSPA